MAKCVASSNLGTPPGTYLYALASTVETTLAAIGSDDVLRIFDSGRLKISTSLRCHTGVTCLSSAGPAHFVTGGRDGLVKCWDPRGRLATEMVEPRSNGIAALACQGHYVAAGTESIREGLGDVSVLVFDVRSPATPLRQYTESHTDTITQLVFHPTQSNVLLSGSTDGLVSLFDLNHEEEEDALQQVLNPRSAVHCAGFLTQDQVYVVSTDEQYAIHTLAKTAADDEELPPPIQFGDVRDTLQCQYVIDVIQPKDTLPLMAYGSTETQTLSICPLGSSGAWSFGPQTALPDAHGEEVVRDIMLIEERAFTCGEDGNVKAWSLVA